MVSFIAASGVGVLLGNHLVHKERVKVAAFIVQIAVPSDAATTAAILLQGRVGEA